MAAAETEADCRSNDFIGGAGEDGITEFITANVDYLTVDQGLGGHEITDSQMTGRMIMTLRNPRAPWLHPPPMSMQLSLRTLTFMGTIMKT
jgi:hypothetical protein